jgi:hypothetical protein
VNVHPAAIAVGLAFLIGGIVGEVSHVLSFAAVVTAATAGISRYTVVLLGRPAAQVERATAMGFFVGLIVSLALLFLDRL